MNILIVDDQRSARRILASALEPFADEITVVEASSLEEARAVLATSPVDLAFVDIRLGSDARNRDGFTLIREIREKTAALPIAVTGFNELAEVRGALRAGARDYLLKEELSEELIAPILLALRDRTRLEKEVLALRSRENPTNVIGLTGASPAMDQLRSAIRRVATSDRPVLVVGPTGSGKELVVRAIHGLGPHPTEPLLDINCGAIPENLMESQLFGHERGAFSGADRRQEGFFAAVKQGTLFLDELGELPMSLQAKLLRVLESGRFRPIGATADQRFEGRVVAATHRDLERRVTQGLFREDLFYRLNVLLVRVPSLDERREDIPALVARFAADQTRPLRFSAAALDFLCKTAWPGNVRQLRNLVDRLAVFSEHDEITPDILLTLLPGPSSGVPLADGTVETLARAILRLPVPNKLAAIEGALVKEALAMADGNKSAAARFLGVHRKMVERRTDGRDPRDPENGG